MRTREQMKDAARAALQRNYWPAVLVAFLVTLIAGSGGSSSSTTTYSSRIDPNFTPLLVLFLAVIFASALALALFLGSALTVGGYSSFLRMLRGEPSPLQGLSVGFTKYWRNILCTFLVGLYTFLWMLLLIIPGIVKSFSYAMAPYILGENPNLTAGEAISLSEDIMRGHRMDLFVLNLSFFGWALLSLLTCGILSIFYVNPYMHLTNAAFYQDVKMDAMRRGVIAHGVLPEEMTDQPVYTA